MIDLGFYERVVTLKDQKKNRYKKIGIMIASGLAVAVWLIVSILAKAGVVACVLVSVLIAAIPFAVTSLSATELEVAISADHIMLSMIYGGRRRKEIFFAEPDDILLIAPNTPDNRRIAEDSHPKQSFEALSKEREGLCEWLVVFKDEKENNYIFIFEAEDGVQKLLKLLKPSAFRSR